MRETALITGASSGIGLHLAKEFAKRKHPLVLVAPVASELDAIATELKAAGAILVKTIAKDLAQSEAPQEIFDELSRERIYVDILVNNGLGNSDHRRHIDLATQYRSGLATHQAVLARDDKAAPRTHSQCGLRRGI